MIRPRLLFAACATAFTLGTLLPAVAADTMGTSKARFSHSTSYVGKPKLGTTVAMIVAGGGPKNFQTVQLVGSLAGPLASAEVGKLTKQYGASNVKSFLDVFKFVVDESVAKVTAAKVALPAPDADARKGGKALSAALYRLGVNDDKPWDVEYMLDNLVTHGIHVAVMNDIDTKYGRSADANYHVVLRQAMLDLKAAYKL